MKKYLQIENEVLICQSLLEDKEVLTRDQKIAIARKQMQQNSLN